jgi:cysteinyl-tRNA synthetase
MGLSGHSVTACCLLAIVCLALASCDTENPGEDERDGPLAKATPEPIASVYGAGGTPLSDGRDSVLPIDDFLYQLQEVDLKAVADTAYDLVIIDYSADGTEEGEFTAAEIATLRDSPSGRKIVLAYLSIGEAEDYRFYWEDDWRPGAPGLLRGPNPDWPGNYQVDYWDPQWQTIILGYVDRLVAAGFDGAYLDLIDAYEGAADQGRAVAAQEMAEFVTLIRAHARASDPDFLIFVQNGAALAGLVPGYLDHVDGIGQEDIYYGYEADDEMTSPEVTAELERQLDRFRAAGRLVLTIDYATTPAHIDRAYARARARGYVPFVTVRELDQLIVNPGHEPD